MEGLGKKDKRGGFVKRFTYEERCLIEKYLGEGLTMTLISTLLDRSKTGVIVEINKNNGPIFYNAQLAQKRSFEEIEKRKQRLKKRDHDRDKKRILEMFNCGHNKSYIRQQLIMSWETITKYESELGICLKKPPDSVIIRIDALEDAIQILTEELEKLNEIIRNKRL